MRVGNFCVLIPEGKELSSGHISLKHDTQYTIRMQNLWRDRRCDATVTIDGKEIGTFRIDQGSSFTLETPPDDPTKGKFTFFKSGTAECLASGELKTSTHDKGLIHVRFNPEKKRITEVKSTYGLRGMGGEWQYTSAEPVLTSRGQYKQMSALSCVPEQDTGCVPCGLEAGMTGLTGMSDQQFRSVASLDYDLAEVVDISIRLVHEEVREMKPRSNAVPAPVG